MNSPEEKAKELVDRFKEYTEDKYAEHWSDAKACALICVDEIIAYAGIMADYWDIKDGEWYKDELVKLQKVKESIQKL